MDCIRIRGGVPLKGSVRISGAKNATLPILCASLLADGDHCFRNVPGLVDVHTTAELLRHLGLSVEIDAAQVTVQSSPVLEPDAPYALVKKMRASVLVLGPLVARYGKARVSLPGGCAIGARPIDQHLKGLESMGAEIELKQGYVHVNVPSGRLRGAEVYMDISTVTGTENLMSAAALAKGRTTLVNAAREPEVEELARVLNKMGARVEGAGTDVVTIDGVEALQPVDHAIMPDRIEAGTYMAAGAITGGDIFLEGVTFDY
ncbi:MAG: UDP-N-acetylglucosamine 1-carboxyvinyltransferase, partial [Myxococcota bacterium]